MECFVATKSRLMTFDFSRRVAHVITVRYSSQRLFRAYEQESIDDLADVCAHVA